MTATTTTTSTTAETQVEQVSALLPQLRLGPVLLSAQSLSQQELMLLGLEVDEQQVSLPAGVELLEASAIEAKLSGSAQAWLKHLQLFSAIGSTNAWMMDGLAQRRLPQSGLGGLVALAECQLAGRGRRGRSWHSPLGSNLALSLGFSLPLPVSALGGLSLLVGMAAVDALDPDGQVGLRLKWPNDVLLDGRKLAGILVEVAQRDGLSEICVGIGVNWKIPPQVQALIDQPVAQVAEFAPDLGRGAGAALLISRIVDFVQAFSEQGFAPMQPHYDNIHAYQGLSCRIIRARDTIEGTVLGVSEAGELRLRTANGEQTFSSGEVSLRKQ